MYRFILLCIFHLRIYLKNSYFITLMISSSISLLLLQFLNGYAVGSLNDNNIWIRSAIFGLWSSATTAAGCIGYQRFQGTLQYLLNNPVSDRQSLAALIVSSASFGVLSFPITAIFAFFLHIPVEIPEIHFFIIQIGMLWLGAVIMDFMIATFSVLTRNAIIYEQIINIPLILISGLFPLPGHFTYLEKAAGWIIPISSPIRLLLYKDDDSWILYVQFICCTVIWLLISNYTSKRLLLKARNNGKLGVIG